MSGINVLALFIIYDKSACRFIQCVLTAVCLGSEKGRIAKTGSGIAITGSYFEGSIKRRF